MNRSPDYTLIAPDYDRRYQESDLVGVSKLLRSIVARRQPERIVEVGCGTGHWLAQMPARAHVVGVDRSDPMLRAARSKRQTVELIRADAVALPLMPASVGLLFCVNALHHFPSPEAWIGLASRLVVPGGSLLLVGANPHKSGTEWYVYRYFEGVRAVDEARFPSISQIKDWLVRHQFRVEAIGTAAPIRQTFVGGAVFASPFLRRRGCSQLALLSDEAYRGGITRIREAVELNPWQEFFTHIDLDFVLARR